MNASTIDEEDYWFNLHLLADTCVEQSPKDFAGLPFSIPKKKSSSINIHSQKSATATSLINYTNNDREVDDHGKGKSSCTTTTFSENNNYNNKMMIMNNVVQGRPNPPPELSREFLDRIEKLGGSDESDVRLAIQKSSSSCSSNIINEKKKEMKMNVWKDHPPELSELANRIENMGGTDVRLVIQKQLCQTDLKNGNSRLLMPCRQIRSEFLNDQEKMVLNTIKENGVNHEGLQVSVIEPCLEVTNLCLKKWDFKSNGSALVLIKNWNSVVQKNGLKVHDVVQVWSFRVGTILHFAMVKLN